MNNKLMSDINRAANAIASSNAGTDPRKIAKDILILAGLKNISRIEKIKKIIYDRGINET